MNRTRRNRISVALHTIALLSPVLALAGCPNGPAAGNTLITINNVTSQINITSIRVIGPNDTSPGGNLLSAPLTQGDSVQIAVTAPDREAEPAGVAWTIIAGGQLNVRVKQGDPNDNRSQLNTSFDTLDTDANDELTFAEVAAGLPAFTALEFDMLDRNGDDAIARAEVGALVRVAFIRFTCVHDGDGYFWNFDGESPGDFCADSE